jgi:hypothetical protein
MASRGEIPGGKDANMAKWDNERFNMQEPLNNIPCTTCKFRLEPVTVGDYTQDRAKYGLCHKYDRKPQEVLWGGEMCEKYEKEE